MEKYEKKTCAHDRDESLQWYSIKLGLHIAYDVRMKIVYFQGQWLRS